MSLLSDLDYAKHAVVIVSSIRTLLIFLYMRLRDSAMCSSRLIAMCDRGNVPKMVEQEVESSD